jgi:putative zinc finger/helix-turn-helix YgiT family protein
MWTVIGTIHPVFKNMICIKCENEVFAEKPNAVIEQEFRGERLKVKMTASACTRCGWTTLSLRQTEELRRLTADAYRGKHGLLTSVQIKSLRKMLGMNQPEFAAFLGVGEASVKRWETWLVQEKSSDQLIRMKCDYSAFLYASSKGFVFKPQGISIMQGQFSISTHLLNAMSNYPVQAVGVRSNVSRFTSRVTSEGQLAALSKEWRKRHSKTCDTDFIQCP